MSEAEFTAFLETIFRPLVAHSVEGSIHYVCMDWRHLFEVITAGRAAYTELKNLCVWNKTNGGMESPSTAPSISWSWSSRMARRHTSTTSSSAATAANADGGKGPDFWRAFEGAEDR
jgi:hypothetical protein